MFRHSSLKESAEKAFKRAVDSIPRTVRVSTLPKSFRVLKPHLEKDEYHVVKMKCSFSFSHQYFGVGVILASVLPFGQSTGVSPKLALHSTFLNPIPTQFFSIAPHTKSSSRFNIWRYGRRITSFAHVALAFKGTTPVVFITCLQKVIGTDKNGRRVDKYVGTYGSGRHYLHLALAEKIVQEMRRQGVNAELHVPAAEHFKGVDEVFIGRIRRPFKTLAHHFEPDELRISARAKFRTINISRPKPLVFTE